MENGDEFDILVIADNPSLEVLPTTFSKSWANQRLCGFTQLEFCLEWVSWFDSPNVIVVSSTFKEDACEATVNRWRSQFNARGDGVCALRVFSFQNCRSVNDLLREVESRGLIKQDFILIDNISTFCSSNLAEQLPAFKRRLKQSRDNVLTMLFSPNGSRERPILGLQNYTNKLMLYNSASTTAGHVKVSKNLFTSETIIRSDLSPCGIALCAHEFSSHFSGNYDFESVDRIVQDILTNEEFLGQNIHVEIMSDAAVGSGGEGNERTAFGATNYASLLRASTLLLQRKCFPLTFDNIMPRFKHFDRPQHHSSANVYVPEGRQPPEGKAVTDSAFGKGFMMQKTATVQRCCFGTNGRLGHNSEAADSICGDGVQLGDECTVRRSILEDGAVVKNGVHMDRCYIGTNVTVPVGATIDSGSVIHSIPPPAELHQQLAEREWRLDSERVDAGYYKWWLVRDGHPYSFWDLQTPLSTHKWNDDDDSGCSSSAGDNPTESDDAERNAEESVTEGGGGGDEHATTGAYQGNVERFFEEVLETMNALLAKENGENPFDAGQIAKMRLEINASRLTNNVSVDDSAKSIFFAFLRVQRVYETFAQLKRVFGEWMPLWRIYFKRDVNKLQMLHAIEDNAAADEKFLKMVPVFVHHLYDDADFLEKTLILEWYDGLPVDSSLKLPTDGSSASKSPSETALKTAQSLHKFIIWLREDDDEDSEESGNEDE